MQKIKHFVFFDLEEDYEFKKTNEKFIKNKRDFYKLDLKDSESSILKAYLNEHNIEYKEDELDEYNNIKTLKFKRAVLDGFMLDNFKDFYVSTAYNNSFDKGIIFYELERLKFTLVYGLSSLEYGLHIYTALRIYFLHLLRFGQLEVIKSLLKTFSFLFFDDLINALLNSSDFESDINSIIYDDTNAYLKSSDFIAFAKCVAIELRKAAIMLRKDESNNILDLIDFILFFKEHKKLLKYKEKLNGKKVKKQAIKISKLAKKYYVG